MWTPPTEKHKLMVKFLSLFSPLYLKTRSLLTKEPLDLWNHLICFTCLDPVWTRPSWTGFGLGLKKQHTKRTDNLLYECDNDDEKLSQSTADFCQSSTAENLPYKLPVNKCYYCFSVRLSLFVLSGFAQKDCLQPFNQLLQLQETYFFVVLWTYIHH